MAFYNYKFYRATKRLKLVNFSALTVSQVLFFWLLGGICYLCRMVIKNASYVISSPSWQKCPAPDRPEYAFIGRSNVGKSSLINMLCQRQSLAKTSSTPGKTQMINHFAIESSKKEKAPKYSWYLVDLPGYGYAKVAQKSRKAWSKMIEDYISGRENLMQLFVLIDGRHKPQAIDLEFVMALGHWQIPFTLVYTKTDKEKPSVVERNIGFFLEQLRSSWQFLPQVIITSATKKVGREEILELIGNYNEKYEEDQTRFK